MRIPFRLKLVVTGALLIGMLGASQASADSPWWHLNSGTRPAVLQLGTAKNEVQEIVTAPGAGWELKVGETPVGPTEGFFESQLENGTYPGFGVTQATNANLQAAMEEVYGAGNVEVLGGPAGIAPVIVKSVGKDADRSVPPVHAVNVGFGKAGSRLVTFGRPDGQIVVTASNLGDADVNGEGSHQVRILDKLPPGLRAVSIEGLAGGARGEQANRGPVECSIESFELLTCTFTGTLPPYRPIEILIGVVVEPLAKE